LVFRAIFVTLLSPGRQKKKTKVLSFDLSPAQAGLHFAGHPGLRKKVVRNQQLK